MSYKMLFVDVAVHLGGAATQDCICPRVLEGQGSDAYVRRISVNTLYICWLTKEDITTVMDLTTANTIY